MCNIMLISNLIWKKEENQEDQILKAAFKICTNKLPQFAPVRRIHRTADRALPNLGKWREIAQTLIDAEFIGRMGIDSHLINGRFFECDRAPGLGLG